MKILERIQAKTPRKHKIAGRIVTALSVASLTIAESGLVDAKPLIKIGLQTLSVALGAKSIYHAQKVQK
jgi:hypothetical protein